MGIQTASSTFTRFHIPDSIKDDFWSFVDEKLQAGRFQEPEDVVEKAVGFSTWEDFFSSDFPYGSYHKGEYVAFQFRVDTRRVPAIVLKKHLREAVQKYRDEHEGKWPSKKERLDIRETVQNWLLSRALPQPSACEVVWNPAEKLMILGTTSTKVLEAFMEYFEGHFRMYPLPLFHVNWALHALPLDGRQKDTLGSLVSVKSPTAMEEGRFVGFEFLTWLWFFAETTPGLIEVDGGKQAQVHLGERMVLTLPGEGKEKVVCTTQANSLDEARTALQRGKRVQELQLLFIVGDNEYPLTLDSALWAVKGLKTPKQMKDNEEEEDPDSLFLEKMYFLEEVSATLNALYMKFLKDRLSPSWDSGTLRALKEWIEGSGEAAETEGGPAEDAEDEAPF